MKITLILAFFVAFFTSCAQLQNLSKEPTSYESDKQRVLTEKANDRDLNLPEGSTILEEGEGFTLRGALGLDSSESFIVNSMTFNVALDKVGFMPLLSVDSSSGVIVTDWYSLDDGKSRIKINIRIVDQEMTDASVVVSLFTQTLDGNRWIDQGINSEQSLKIKESILSCVDNSGAKKVNCITVGSKCIIGCLCQYRNVFIVYCICVATTAATYTKITKITFTL